jgi:outer membrane protein, multidrug efflux system
MKNIILFIALSMLYVSCKSSEKLVKQSSISVPGNFQQDSDTLSISDLKPRSFFSDEKLNQLIDTALANNYDLHIAIQRVEVAKASFRERKFIWLPSLDLTSGVGARKFGDYTIDGVGNYDTQFSTNLSPNQQIPAPAIPDYMIGFQSNWEIDIWGKLRNLKKAAYFKYLESAEAKKAVQTSMIAQVAQLYYTLVSLDLELKIVRDNINLQQQVMEMVMIQKEGGRANELAVKQVRAQWFNTRTFAELLEQEIVSTENQLNALLGRFPQKIERTNILTRQAFLSEIKTGVPSKMLLNRPDIRATEMGLLAAQADVKAARAAFFPTIQLNAFMGIQAFRGSVLFSLPASLAWQVGGGLLQPIFNRSRLKSNFRAKKAEQLMALYQYEKSIVESFNEVITVLNKIENFRSIIDLKAEEVNLLKEAIIISQDLYKTGNANYIEVITAQKNVLEEEINLIRYKREQLIGTIDLYRALGGGWK